MSRKEGEIGILAYGSLIDSPGQELEEIIIGRIKTKTPFNVEYKRKSSKRDDAPTLIPVEVGGCQVDATILLIKEGICINDVNSILYRREIYSSDKSKFYGESEAFSINKISIITLPSFQNIDLVIYTSIGQNLTEPVTPSVLANLAIGSILGKSGDNELDGIHYLNSAIKNGVITPLTTSYVKEILDRSKTSCLEDAIIFFDNIRNGYKVV